jgi:predicted alpha-1,2-mannosidase
MNKWFLLLPLILLAGCDSINRNSDYLNTVDPFIGTGGHGHTFPGAAYPFGMVQLSPDTRKDNWDACSGYHYSDSTILGFSHTHLSGTGVGDYGDIRFMSCTGDLKIRSGEAGNPGSGYQSRFSHNGESASPGYYQVFLEDYGINAEFTVSPRCGYHQFTFPASDSAYILIDLKESVVTEQIKGSSVRFHNANEISGMRRTSGWANDQAIYFYAVFSRPFDSFGIADGGIIGHNDTVAEGKDLQAFARFKTRKDEKVSVKVGISSVSEEGAKKNLMSEIPGWDFEQIREKAKAAWQEKLSKVEVKGGSMDDRTKFYTALYHCYIAPNLFSDVDGSYRGHDGKIHQSPGFNVYTVFSLWDTYRALHPLMTILEPETTRDFIKSFLDMSEKGGLLPVWELAGNETNCMIGYHSIPVIADAYFKGIGGFDANKAYNAMVKSAEADQFGLKYYRDYGYIPAEMEGEAISKTLEYAYDDWCIAMMAKDLGKNDDYLYYMQRAQSYKNLFDPDTRFLRGKRNGMFTEPFDPTEVNFMLTEANAWQYTFYTPQDISGLIQLMGGDSLFEKKLDEMFTTQAGLTGREQSDITGLIGQYAHGNEPSHHMAYLYNYIGKPFKTQKLAREIMNDLYGVDPAGLCGNEDCGQMSAWFVMSAMGLYPVTPGIGYYAIGSPLFEETRIHLGGERELIIKAKNNNSSNIYIQSASWNGGVYDKSYFNHQDLINGGILALEMGSRKGNGWAEDKQNRPVAAITEHIINPVPYFKAVSGSFQENMVVSLNHLDPEAVIYFRIEDENMVKAYDLYREPLNLLSTSKIIAYAAKDQGNLSKTAFASFFQVHNGWKVTIKEPYSNQYTGGGEMALVDGQHGGANFRTGSWQGYQGVDVEATVDMGEITRIRKVAATFLQDQRSWIFMPEKVEFSVSDNNLDFQTFAIIENSTSDSISEAVIWDFKKEGLKEKGRYIRMKAYNRGTCPEWHVGAGDKAWIFIDEISVE